MFCIGLGCTRSPEGLMHLSHHLSHLCFWEEQGGLVELRTWLRRAESADPVWAQCKYCSALEPTSRPAQSCCCCWQEAFPDYLWPGSSVFTKNNRLLHFCCAGIVDDLILPQTPPQTWSFTARSQTGPYFCDLDVLVLLTSTLLGHFLRGRDTFPAIEADTKPVAWHRGHRKKCSVEEFQGFELPSVKHQRAKPRT